MCSDADDQALNPISIVKVEDARARSVEEVAVICHGFVVRGKA
jgi:hypothetical protein